MTISTTPEPERPRERCLKSGAISCSLRELLAIQIGSGPPGLGCFGVVDQLLERIGAFSSQDMMERAFFTAMEAPGTPLLQNIRGLGSAYQARLLSSFELARRYQRLRITPNIREDRSLQEQALAKIPQEQRQDPYEWFGFIPVFSKLNFGPLCVVHRGSRGNVSIDPKELFGSILALRPHGVFLAHNHPGGSLLASEPDRHLTREVQKVCHLLELVLFGHWIVAPEGEIMI